MGMTGFVVQRLCLEKQCVRLEAETCPQMLPITQRVTSLLVFALLISVASLRSVSLEQTQPTATSALRVVWDQHHSVVKTMDAFQAISAATNEEVVVGVT